MELRELTALSDFRQCEALQQVVWGEPTPEVTAASFRATVHAGALVAGAWVGETLAGFAYAFPSFVEGRVGMHSHLLAVLPEYRGRGVGQALKWFQRDWCLERDILEMTWTFDPLRAKNARLNLEHLGAYVAHYYPDFYGSLGGSLNGALPTDRVVATWALASDRVAAFAAGTPPAPAIQPTAVSLTREPDGEPRVHEGIRAERIWLELPAFFDPNGNFEHALRWRLALREAMMPLLGSGYRATRFVAGGYVLEKP